MLSTRYSKATARLIPYFAILTSCKKFNHNSKNLLVNSRTKSASLI